MSWLEKISRPAVAGALAISMLLLACAFMKPFVFRFGPADKDYVKGFRVGWERGTSSRWARANASVELPVSVFGPTRLIVVGARPGQQPTRVEIQQNGVSLGSFMVGRKIAPYAFELNSHQASIFQFDADTGDPGHGMKLERIVLEPKQLWSVVPNVGVLVRVFLGTALLAAAFGFSKVLEHSRFFESPSVASECDAHYGPICCPTLDVETVCCCTNPDGVRGRYSSKHDCSARRVGLCIGINGSVGVAVPSVLLFYGCRHTSPGCRGSVSTRSNRAMVSYGLLPAKV